MAMRPVFVPSRRADRLVDEISISFGWNPGLAPIQKKRNIAALHEAAERRNLSPLLEVSTKSDDELGQRLSAFNLVLRTNIGTISVESAFQGSKVFELGGPYTDFYEMSGREIKKDPRIKKSGKLMEFNFLGEKWPLNPRTAFYDWLYLNALREYEDNLVSLSRYNGFTDIEFNPERSINCQARTCAVFVSLIEIDHLERTLSSKAKFIEMAASFSLSDEPAKKPGQLKLL